MRLQTIGLLRSYLGGAIEAKKEKMIEIIEEGDNNRIKYHIEEYQQLLDAETDFEQWWEDFKNKSQSDEDIEYVTRCIDCEHCNQKEENRLPIFWCNKWNNVITKADYCSYAIRRKSHEL